MIPYGFHPQAKNDYDSHQKRRPFYWWRRR